MLEQLAKTFVYMYARDVHVLNREQCAYQVYQFCVLVKAPLTATTVTVTVNRCCNNILR